LDELHNKYAVRALHLILRLRGLFVKLGQVGTTRADFIPKAYRDELATLLDQVPPLPGDEIAKMVEAGLGRPISEVFSEFDYEALGAASIGQAHLARLHDGRQVVVKVKSPTAYDMFLLDFTTALQFCQLAQPEQVPFLKELQKQFLTEFDFMKEAHSLEKIHDNLDKAGFLSGRHHHQKNLVKIPLPIMKLCSNDIVVMEFIPGRKLIDSVLDYYAQLASAMGLNSGPAVSSPPPQGEMVQVPPKPATWLPSPKLVLGIARMYLNRYVTWYAVWFWNHSAAWIVPKFQLQPPQVVKSLDGASLLATVIQVHGHQLLIDGMFNGDPVLLILFYVLWC
jgi:aarF domain-containing kinase